MTTSITIRVCNVAYMTEFNTNETDASTLRARNFALYSHCLLKVLFIKDVWYLRIVVPPPLPSVFVFSANCVEAENIVNHQKWTSAELVQTSGFSRKQNYRLIFITFSMGGFLGNHLEGTITSKKSPMQDFTPESSIVSPADLHRTLFFFARDYFNLARL